MNLSECVDNDLEEIMKNYI